MVITRGPLRISLGGGGTDLPTYDSEFGGFVISAAIDKHVYITLHETFQQAIISRSLLRVRESWPWRIAEAVRAGGSISKGPWCFPRYTGAHN